MLRNLGLLLNIRARLRLAHGEGLGRSALNNPRL